jgi:hypothetical protein
MDKIEGNHKSLNVLSINQHLDGAQLFKTIHVGEVSNNVHRNRFEKASMLSTIIIPSNLNTNI